MIVAETSRTSNDCRRQTLAFKDWRGGKRSLCNARPTLLAGLDLLTGHVHGAVEDRHRSREFVAFLRQLDRAYPKRALIRVILDNHSAHISKETRAYLASVPNRFEFVFTPKHGSWLNLVESFFGKLARTTLLRGIRVESEEELKERILRHLDWLNADPVVFKWDAGSTSWKPLE